MTSNHEEVFQLARMYSGMFHGELGRAGVRYMEYEGIPDDVKDSVEEEDSRSLLNAKYTPTGRMSPGILESHPVEIDVYQRGEIGPLTNRDIEMGEPAVHLSDINQPFGDSLRNVEKVQKRVDLWEATGEGRFTPVEIYEEELDAVKEMEGTSVQVSQDTDFLDYLGTDSGCEADFIMFEYQFEEGGRDVARVYSERDSEYITLELEEDWVRALEPDLEREICPEFEPSLGFQAKKLLT